VEYLDKNILSSIETRLQFAKLELSKQLPSDLYRLAILQKHGGVYVDVSIVSL
jgi:mannosyltransferase OCH1-like enzyme